MARFRSAQHAGPVSYKEMVGAEEGTYFFAQNPTPGTGIVGPVSTTFTETSALLTVFNSSVTTNGNAGVNIFPQFLRLYVTTAGATDTRVQFTHALDNIQRFSSGGTTLGKVNVNMTSPITSQATVNFGAVVATAASASRRLMGTTVFRGTIGIVEDCYEIVFGSADGSGMGASRATTVQDMARMVAPVVIGPGQTYVLHDWSAGIATGRTYAVEFGFIER